MKKQPNYVYMELESGAGGIAVTEAIGLLSDDYVYYNKKLIMKIAIIVSQCEDGHYYIGVMKDGLKNQEAYLEEINELSKPHNTTFVCPMSVGLSCINQIRLRRYDFFNELSNKILIMRLRIKRMFRKKKSV